MKSKVSKSFEAIISRTTLMLRREGIATSFVDRLVVEVLGDEATFGYALLQSLVGEQGLSVVVRRVVQRIISNPVMESLTPELRYMKMCEELGQSIEAKRISTAHLLYYATQDEGTATAEELRGYGIRAEDILDAIARAVGGGDSESVGESEQTKSDDLLPSMVVEVESRPTSARSKLDAFGQNLTDMARRGEIDPVVGRDAEIARVVQILSRRKKCNPLLIGEAGVGKSAIVEGLALRVVEGRVPNSLARKEIYILDMATLVAGTKFRGEFEQRMHELLEAIESECDTIIFIDEIHTIVGAGANQGALDVANMLKPALARGKIQLIGATTPDEYRTSIERDAALERRFQGVRIEPTTRESTLDILSQLEAYYSQYHGVTYSREALRACVDLADNYIPDRHFPDKAIDLMDEAGVWACVEAGMEQGSRVVEPHHVAHVTHLITGIPLESLSANERQRLSNLQSHLERVVVGQQEVASHLAKSLVRLRAGLKQVNRPWGVFLFVGSTGVGKTLMAKEIAQWLRPTKQNLIRFDMSEYGERHTLSRLIGAPAGYVGYGEGGLLSEAVRRNPNSVLLFDEIDRAHPDIYNLMLQIFDEGYFTDTLGRRIDCRHTLIILTTNLGANSLGEGSRRIGFQRNEQSLSSSVDRDTCLREVESHFSKEFLGRVDEVLVFNELGFADLCQIARLELDSLAQRAELLGLNLRVEEGVVEHIASLAQKRRQGARAIKRLVATMIETPLSEQLLFGPLSSQECRVVVEDGEVVVADRVVRSVA